MSAPESTSSKGRPSLLSETAPGVADSSSRILASLEGRAVAQPIPRRRSKKPLMAAALAVIGFGAFGAWQWQRIQQGEPTAVAAAPAAQAGTGAGKAQPAMPANASATALAAAASGAAAAPQAAVIVADDPVQADRAAAASSGAGNDPLSRALASGVAPADKTASPVAVAGASGANAAVAKQASAAAVASRADRQTAKSRYAEKDKKIAAEHASKHAKKRSKSAKDDPDVDLLAALVARTKPYEPNAANKNPPKGTSAAAASAKTAQPSAGAHHASLGDQLKACDKGNFFEAQACRWRVCSGHWGADPACPSTASAAQTH